jgi:hypothetical protein
MPARQERAAAARMQLLCLGARTSSQCYEKRGRCTRLKHLAASLPRATGTSLMACVCKLTLNNGCKVRPHQSKLHVSTISTDAFLKVGKFGSRNT